MILPFPSASLFWTSDHHTYKSLNSSVKIWGKGVWELWDPLPMLDEKSRLSGVWLRCRLCVGPSSLFGEGFTYFWPYRSVLWWAVHRKRLAFISNCLWNQSCLNFTQIWFFHTLLSIYKTFCSQTAQNRNVFNLWTFPPPAGTEEPEVYLRFAIISS